MARTSSLFDRFVRPPHITTPFSQRNVLIVGTLQCPNSALNAMRSLMRSSKGTFLEKFHSNPAFPRRWVFALDSFI
jgi:hypothetical protein